MHYFCSSQCCCRYTIATTLFVHFLAHACTANINNGSVNARPNAGNWTNGRHLHTTNIEQKLLLGQPYVFDFNRVRAWHTTLVVVLANTDPNSTYALSLSHTHAHAHHHHINSPSHPCFHGLEISTSAHLCHGTYPHIFATHMRDDVCLSRLCLIYWARVALFGFPILQYFRFFDAGRKSNCFNLLTGTWGKFRDPAEAMKIFVTSKQLLQQTVDVLAMLYSRFRAPTHHVQSKGYANAIADVNGARIHTTFMWPLLALLLTTMVLVCVLHVSSRTACRHLLSTSEEILRRS